MRDVAHMPNCIYRGQRITSGSQSSPLTTWIPGIKHKSTILMGTAFTSWTSLAGISTIAIAILTIKSACGAYTMIHKQHQNSHS